MSALAATILYAAVFAAARRKTHGQRPENLAITLWICPEAQIRYAHHARWRATGCLSVESSDFGTLPEIVRLLDISPQSRGRFTSVED